MLFGDDLPKSVKEISETNQVGAKVSSKHPAQYQRHSIRPFFPHRQHNQNHKPFLWTFQGPVGGSLADHKRKGKPEQQLHLLSLRPPTLPAES